MNNFTKLIFKNKILFMFLSSGLFYIIARLIIILIKHFFNLSKDTPDYTFLVTITMLNALILSIFINSEIINIHEKPITIEIDSVKIHDSYSIIRSDDKTYKVKNSTYGLFNENTTITIANYGEYYLLVD